MNFQKRVSKKRDELTEKKLEKMGITDHMRVILEEMCSRVGARIYDIDFSTIDWFKSFSWKRSEENKFIDWLTDYLHSSYSARKEIIKFETKSKKKIEEFSRNFVFNFGWINKENT